jgi:MPBQ/MSBQ methyltransferase
MRTLAMRPATTTTTTTTTGVAHRRTPSWNRDATVKKPITTLATRGKKCIVHASSSSTTTTDRLSIAELAMTPKDVDAHRRESSSTRRPNAVVGDLAAKTKAKTAASVQANATPTVPAWVATHGKSAAIAAGAVAVIGGIKYVFDTPSRTYVAGENTVGNEYDAWTEEGILEYYWGEHIHLGWYSDEELAKGAGTLLGCKVKDFIEAKFDFVDEMADWSEAVKPAKVLDVGCGIGGTSRHLAKRFGEGTQVTGITLSPNQVKRATELAAEQGVPNANFRVMNALEMEFEDNTFDLVWACESGEHMPDKKAYVDEMVRVLKPGGKIVIATWCQRETPPEFTQKEKDNLQFLYDEWAHPYFISYEEYERLLQRTGSMQTTASENWVKNTLVSWRHSIWVGVWDPWPVVFAGPKQWYKVVREIVTLERMHRAFDSGLMTYGMIKGTKK